eukprot:4064397-Pyramimonas_sp.AAC.1
MTGIDLETTGASACRMNCELCLLPELGPRNCSHCSSHPERCCGFPALTSGCSGGCRAVNDRYSV